MKSSRTVAKEFLMADTLHEEKTARHLDRLSAALDSGAQQQVQHLLKNLSASEIGDLLESMPITRRLAVWEMTDPELEGDVLVEVNDEVRASLDPRHFTRVIWSLQSTIWTWMTWPISLDDLPNAVTIGSPAKHGPPGPGKAGPECSPTRKIPPAD